MMCRMQAFEEQVRSRPRGSVAACTMGMTLGTFWNTQDHVASKTSMSLGEILEIGYCIAKAIYLFGGLTYLIPATNPIGVNTPPFPIIPLTVTRRKRGNLATDCFYRPRFV